MKKSTRIGFIYGYAPDKINSEGELEMSLENPIYKKKTFCNPMSMPSCPRGVEFTWDEIMKYTGEEN